MRIAIVGLACFLGGWLTGSRPSAEISAAQTTAKPAFPMSARLGSNLWLQRSAEYRACCLQTYQTAELRLESLLLRAQPKPARPAVVMDLDETVFDNSAFQTCLYANELEYTDALWADYEVNYPQDVGLIPGAKAFIDKAESLGVTVIYISNRGDAYRAGTEKALTRLGLASTPLADRLSLKSKSDGGSDKSHRREAAAAKYNVLLWFGDNLRDFSESFAAKRLAAGAAAEEFLKAQEARCKLADEARVHWGLDWFVLPNPVYGEWDKLVGPNPLALLRPTSMPKKNR